MRDDFLKEVISFLKSNIGELSVVVMPDFFLDRLINLDCDVQTFSKNIEQVAKRKGGSIDRINQTELRGGNAVNTASALATLNAKVTPIVCADKRGMQLLRYYLKPLKASLSHIKILDGLPMTTAIELKTEKGKINVMLRDLGALADFGPQNLDKNDLEIAEKADYVCVFNWAGTRRFGTQLVKRVFQHVKTKGRGKTYYDTADPIPNIAKIPELVKNVLQSKCVDILSVNENEAVCYASQLSTEIARLEKKLKFDELAMESARILASRLSARIDLHTTGFSATFTKRSETIVSAFKVQELRATGAGDAWNAGNIIGDAYGLSDGSRLTLANAVAAYYISSLNGTHPTKAQLIKFCGKIRKD
ncbi:carbohydrate kinase family protein [Candidatus Bathyarchaeota archaeon]|nr:carbohydrate kinase family protein [Candidatus Bathyarchaeota archaeon]